MGDKCEITRETSGREVADKGKSMRAEHPESSGRQVRDDKGREVGDKCQITWGEHPESSGRQAGDFFHFLGATTLSRCGAFLWTSHKAAHCCRLRTLNKRVLRQPGASRQQGLGGFTQSCHSCPHWAHSANPIVSCCAVAMALVGLWGVSKELSKKSAKDSSC